MSGAEPMVYLLLLNWRGWRDTIECLESVFRQGYPRFRVVVCDNDSGDGSLDRIAAWAAGELAASAPPEGHPLRATAHPPVPKPLRVARYDRAGAETAVPEADPAPLVLVQTGGNLGFAGGNNVGLRYILRQGDAGYVWLLNNDTVVDARALEGMVRLAEREPRAGMLGAKLLHYDRPEVIQAAAGGRLVAWQGLTTFLGGGERDAGQRDEVLEPDYITGASLLVRAAALEEIGEMDERYFLYSEEVDWCLQARRHGWKLLYSPGSRVWHKGGQSVGYASPLHDYYTVRSMLLLVRKFHPALLPLAFGYSLYRCLAPKLVRRQGGRLGAVVRAYRDFLTLPPAPRPARTAAPREGRG